MTSDRAEERLPECRWPRPWWAVLLVAVVLMGAGPPEVVPIRVPSSKIGTWFPPGTELRGMPADDFEALVSSARKRSALRAAPAARLLRARHFVRWDGDRLAGRSELVVAATGTGTRPALLPLSPWTPAIEPSAPGSAALRMRDDGATFLRLDSSGESISSLKWELRARPGSEGRRFAIGLPDCDASTLILDLPEDWSPEGLQGLAEDRDPSPVAGRRSWRFDGRGGQIDLVFHQRKNREAAVKHPPAAWVSGPTRIELSDALATSTTEWTITLDPRGPRRLELELDPGLDLIEASGPAVEQTRAEPAGAGTRVTVVLGGAIAGATPLTLKAVARVPTEGPWTVPAVRPLGAFWTGGRTAIHLDASRILKDCRERAGRRVVARADDSGDSGLVFEADAPRPVAELVFGKPRTDVAVEVRGQLLLGNSSPRLESQLTWRVNRGSLLGLDLDLPPAWVPDRVSVAGIDEPLAWHATTIAGGGVRIHVTPPSVDFGRGSLILNVSATASIAGGRGPILLPRVRPVGVPVVDERWLAWTESGLTLQPVSATGLAWIDPSLVIGQAIERPETPGLREALAWRWIAEKAEAKVDRDGAPSEPSGSIRLLASADRDRLQLDCRITIDPAGEPLRSIPLSLANSVGDGSAWWFVDEATGRELPSRPIAQADRSSFGLPQDGSAWQLDVFDSGTAPFSIHGRLEVPWNGRGRLPILTLPARFRSRNLVIVEVARNLQAKLEASGLKRLEESVAAETIDKGRRAGRRGTQTSDPVARRLAGAFGYDRPGGRLELSTEALEPARTGGVIEQAVLTTFVDPGGPCRQRLTLRIAFSDARVLDLTLPAGASLIRVRRDGQTIVPSRNGPARSLPLASPSSSRSSSTFVLDYLTPRRAWAEHGEFRPERPLASLPYLAFRWEVVAPAPWTVTDHGPGLVAADPAPASSWGRRLATLLPRFLRPSRGTRSRADDDLIGALDRQVVETLDGEMTLGECLTRWDADLPPLVVDRMALESAGWGPRSRVTPPRQGASALGAARAVLGQVGLAAVAVNDAVLITTRAEAPDRLGGPFHDPATRDAWHDHMREALIRGSDTADRFQTVARWRGEVTPRTANAGDPAEVEPAYGWRIWRFAAPGWPETATAIHLADQERVAAWGWAAGLTILLLGIACRGVSPVARALGLIAVIVASLVALAEVPSSRLAIAAGVINGSLGVLLYWVAMAFPRRLRGRNGEPRASGSGRARLGGPGVVAGLVAALGLAATESARWASAASDDKGPILVLFPFDGVPDPARKPDRAIMRLADYKRLKDLAEDDEHSSDVLSAVAATHEVSWSDSGESVIATEVELEGPEHGRAKWTFPVGDARDISATLDGDAVPVLIEPGAKAASVPVAGSGRHRLHLRRIVHTRRTGGVESLSLPLSALASARIRVTSGPRGSVIDVSSARGGLSKKGSAAEGLLGPTDHLDVRWQGDGASERPAAPSTVDAMLLWDAEPAGDRLRARWTCRNPVGTSLIRLRLEPGLVVRSSTIPGAWDMGLRTTDTGPLWIARVDPPMPDGATIRMEFWRPRPASGGAAAPAERTMPRVEVLGAESDSLAIGFRRPADWAGRLEPSPASDPITEEAFVRAWGTLPPEPLTLSGVTRMTRSAPVAVRTGPIAARLSVLPAVELELGPGRIDLRLDAKLAQVAGRSYHAELVIPAGLNVLRVDGDGLTDWSRSGERLLVRFDDPTPRPRSVRLVGWLPVPVDPLATSPAPQEVAVPWPAWAGAEILPGTLTVTAPGPFQLSSTAGVVALAPESLTEPSGKTASERRSYRVERSEGLGRLRWSLEPARVDVQIRSQVTIQPDSAEWVAVARYDVSGGPSDSIRLEIPTAWADSAELKLVGGRAQINRATRGQITSVTVRPERPIWGSQELMVHSVRSLAANRALVFPELRPITGGSRETYLALVNASGRRIAPAGEGGLQPIDDASRFQSAEFATATELPTWIFRARTEGWSLKVEAPGDLPLASGLAAGQVRVGAAEVEFISDGNGSGVGSLRCQVREQSGPFLAVDLPESSTPVWAAVDGTPARPLRAASGRWFIPVEERAAREVTMIWKSPAPWPGGAVPLPALAPAGPSTFVSLWGNAAVDASTRNRTLEAVPIYWQELSRAQQLGRSLLQQVAEIDRSSTADRERLVMAIVEFELLLRSAERAAVRETSERAAVRDDALKLVRQRMRAAQSEVSDALEIVGLDDLARAARIHLGLAPDDSASPVLERAEPAVPVRLRRLGPGRRFLGPAAAAPRAQPPMSAMSGRPG